VFILKVQKFIKKKEVNPINSHPKKRVIKLEEQTKKTILSIKKFKKIMSLSTLGSYLKYEKA
jgi:hypothetical protein